ncbi:sigma-70 family RNA polymerase sigma factor [Macrococcoides canis]|uniref:sigma-70 family RNA polymerase sigma factor n=1 Tax=Macrococcoides canis TaxID=1855823 RepID=UPI00207CD196|nr:RNA polymerase sigma factor RpoD/SigA [Macrococcus canis]MCO4097059.1 sigma-70 family RNA polymerase sigma factor [Macrococcus canis]UTH09684.1 sigma-70 family RNA polymerase sigma factor [Macrococcus canis]
MNKHELKLIEFLTDKFPERSIDLTYEELKEYIDRNVIVTSPYLYDKLFSDYVKGETFINKLGFRFNVTSNDDMEEDNTKELHIEKTNEDQNESFDLAAALLAEGYIAEDSAEYIHSKAFEDNFNKHTIISFENNEEYFSQLKEEGDDETVERIVIANQQLVKKIAMQYYNVVPKGGLELDDFISFGQKGLLKAIERFDIERGYQFSTYATHWIKQAISRGYADESRIIRLPVHVHESLNKIRKVIRNKDYDSMQLMIADIKAHSDLSEEQIEKLLLYDHLFNKAQVSLSTYIGEDQDSEIGDFIIEPTEENHAMFGDDLVENEIFRKSLTIYIDDLIHKDLKPREADVIIKRFGLNGTKVMTLEEIGEEHGVTRERIRQIEKKVLRKLSRHQVINNFRDYWEAN